MLIQSQRIHKSERQGEPRLPRFIANGLRQPRIGFEPLTGFFRYLIEKAPPKRGPSSGTAYSRTCNLVG